MLSLQYIILHFYSVSSGCLSFILVTFHLGANGGILDCFGRTTCPQCTWVHLAPYTLIHQSRAFCLYQECTVRPGNICMCSVFGLLHCIEHLVRLKSFIFICRYRMWLALCERIIMQRRLVYCAWIQGHRNRDATISCIWSAFLFFYLL